MKDFFKLQITNKKLLPCLAIFLFVFLVIYFLSAHLQKEPEIMETPKILQPAAKPKTPTIMTYQSRDPFRTIIKSPKPVEQSTEFVPSFPGSNNITIDQSTTESANQETSVNGIITSGGVSSALIHTPSGAQIVSMGDFVPGLGRVTKITADQVILQNEVDQTTLTLGGE